MFTCAASSNSVVGPTNNQSNEDETSQKIQLRVADSDSYLDKLGNFGLELVEEGNEYNDVVECEEEDADVIGKKPYVGMRFQTADKAYNFYNSYAGQVGFSIRKATQGRNKNGVSSIRFVCSKSGVPHSQKKMEMPIGSSIVQRTPERERGQTRIGCGASCRIHLENDGIWSITVFVEEHNHELIISPSKRRNLRSQKRLTKEQKELAIKMKAQNIGTAQIWEYFADQQGGKEFIRIKKKDISNVAVAENRKYLGVDVDTTLLYFQKRQEKDPEFFWAVQPDGNGSIKCIFWVDGRARRAYQEFGDVVTFDTTYQTNKYSFPLAPFLGVDHHRFSIFYGMALIQHEDAETFTWLFNTWLEAMYGKHPKSIITDQDRAMKKAIEIVFPNTKHRCCQWHVMRKAREKFGPLLNEKKGFQEELSRVINRSISVLDFERGWLAMVDRFKLHNHKHIKTMFLSQAEWVPAYFRDTFFADMSTTQRSESMNATMKLWADNHKSIYQFALQMEKMIEGIWQKESDEDIKTMNEIPSLWSNYQIEFEARKVYTRNVFSVFKEIMQESTLGFVNEIKKDVQYEVQIDFHPSILNWVPETYLIDVDKVENKVSCSCRGFEFEGLLCAHAIKVMHHVNMRHLPDRYILKRWTKGANANVKKPIGERGTEEGSSKELQTLRFAAIKEDVMNFARLGTTSAKAFNYLKELLRSGTEKLLELSKPGGGVELELTSKRMDVVEFIQPTPESISSKRIFLDPPDAHCKGKRKKLTRFKNVVEKHARKMRTCSICNAKKGHNARTCPKRKGSQKEAVSEESDAAGSNRDDAEDEDTVSSDDSEIPANEHSV